MKRIVALVGLGLAGCASYPTSSVDQGAQPGHFRFAGPVGASVRIDGNSRGTIGDKPLIVDVSSGKHVVEEAVGGSVVLHRDYEIDAGATVEVRSDR